MSLYNDGNFAVGSRTLTINSVTYIAENYGYEEPIAKSEDVTNADGDFSGSVAWAGPATLSATLQLSGSQAIPEQGQTFTTDVRGGNVGFVILTVSTPEEAQGRKKVNITAKVFLD